MNVKKSIQIITGQSRSAYNNQRNIHIRTPHTHTKHLTEKAPPPPPTTTKTGSQNVVLCCGFHIHIVCVCTVQQHIYFTTGNNVCFMFSPIVFFGCVCLCLLCLTLFYIEMRKNPTHIQAQNENQFKTGRHGEK